MIAAEVVRKKLVCYNPLQAGYSMLVFLGGKVMTLKVEVQMTAKIMYNFMLHHTYTSLGGILMVCFGIVAVVVGVQSIGGGNSSSTLAYFMLGILFIIGNPIMLWNKAKQQVKRTPAFQKPLTYEFGEEGVTISQEKTSELIKWEQISKVSTTSTMALVYVSRVRAFILPKDAFKDQYADFVKMVSTNVEPSKVKFRTMS